jgi:nucleoside-diphosphate-sugar epimerase
MKKKILLTGASGSVGLETLRELVQHTDKYDVTAFDLENKSSKKKLQPFAKDVRLVFGDITRLKDVEKVSRNQDFVIHLAAVIPPLADEKPKLAEAVNIKGTQNLLAELKKHSPDAFFLYSSSISIYGDRVNNPMIKVGDELKPSIGDEYAHTKIAAEKAVRNSGLRWTIFRFTGIMQPSPGNMDPLMFHMPLDTSFEIATARDTGYALVQAIRHESELQGRIFNLSGGEKCRIIYRNFLNRSFALSGLGKDIFPDEAFASANFHCGYYADNLELENILHFQRDNIDDYFRIFEKKTKAGTKFIVRILRPLIIKKMLKLSDPLNAKRANNKELMARFNPEVRD